MFNVLVSCLLSSGRILSNSRYEGQIEYPPKKIQEQELKANAHPDADIRQPFESLGLEVRRGQNQIHGAGS